MIDERVGVLSSEEVAQACFLTRLAAPRIAAEAAPGQFVEIRVSEQDVPLLRLPLSICGADPAGGTIELLYERVGPKSAAFSHLQPGSKTTCLGPLGRGFGKPPGGHGALLVGGGVGLPPLLFWGSRLRGQGYPVTLLAGARTAAKQLPDGLLAAAAQKVCRATDDGSMGYAGLVTGLLEEELKKKSPQTVYTCGPHAMMAVVADLCQLYGVACQASLEEYMACGIGICMGCVVETCCQTGERTSDYAQYLRVCVDGPVFDAAHLRWKPR